MQTHLELNDLLFEQTFENKTFDSVVFTHEAHLRLAWIHVRKYGKVKAIENISQQLFEFVSFLGAKDKYNQTLTVVAIEIVNHFMQKSKTENFQDFIFEFPHLNSHFKELVASHYSMDVFSSPEAKKVYLKPDLCDF